MSTICTTRRSGSTVWYLRRKVWRSPPSAHSCTSTTLSPSCANGGEEQSTHTHRGGFRRADKLERGWDTSGASVES